MRTFLKKMLPQPVWSFLTQSKNRVQLAKASLMMRVAPLRYVGYVLSPHFYADFAGFAAGAGLFSQRTRSAAPNLAKLRRNVHRIEKGMSFASRRTSFALDYVQDTVANYAKLCALPDRAEHSEFDWARDVLSDYFNMTESDDPRYLAAQGAFAGVHSTDAGDTREVPFTYANQSPAMEVERVMALLHQRKSVRDYLPEPVAQEALDLALEAASSAPSSCNRQPYCYYILNAAERAQQAARISVGTGGWVQNIQCLAVVVGDTSNFPNAVNRHSIYVDSTLSIMPFVLALEAQGYSTCLINWADDHDRRTKMGRMLDLEPHQRVILSIAIGKADPAAVVPYSKKKFRKEICRHV